MKGRGKLFVPKVDDNYFNFKTYTWNVQRKGTPEEVDKVIADILKPSDFPDIICLQEANLPACDTETANFKWFCEGTVGLAILVNKSRFYSEEKVVEIGKFQSICEQINVLEVNEKGKCLVKVIGCHIPPSTDILSHELWEKLNNILKATPINERYILVGDFNAQIGKIDLNNSYNRSFGQMLYHSVSNENGQQLKDLALSAHLRVLSSSRSARNFYTDKTKCFTYQSGESTSQQSYVLGCHLMSANNINVFLRRAEKYNHAILGCAVRIYFTKSEEDANAQRPVVSTWNTKGMTPAKVDTILNVFNLPVICVQEVFLTSEQDILTDNYTWLCSKNMWAKNVGILVKKQSNISAVKFEAISDSLCVVDLSIDEKPLKVISCHLPVKTHPKHETVLTQLTDLVKGITEETFFVLAGDFNIKSNIKDSSDDSFFMDFVKKNNLCMEENLHSHKKKTLSLTSVISKTVYGSPNQILIPSSFQKKKGCKLFVKWIPFIENGVVMMVTNDTERNKSFKNFIGSDELNQSCKMVVVDGVEHKIRTSEYFELGDVEVQPPLSEEIIEKYKNTPPSTEELGKLLKDFVIFQDATEKSNFTYSSFHLLLKSFKEGRTFGTFTLEDDCTQEHSENTSSSRSVRIRWNGIVIDEVKSEDGNFFKLKSRVANSLIRKLHETCYYIKSKKSFYNEGFEPMAKYVPKINDVLRKMVKSDFKSEEAILSFIEEFFTTDTDVELVFGPDFQNNFKAILSYAVEKDLKIRFFTSHEKPVETRDDHIAICKRKTPQQIRDNLLKANENVRYILIPPCGLGGNSRSFLEKHLKEMLKQENKISSTFWNKSTGEQKKPKINQGKAVSPKQRGKKTPQQQHKTGQRGNQALAKKTPTHQQSLNQRKNAQAKSWASLQQNQLQQRRNNQVANQRPKIKQPVRLFDNHLTRNVRMQPWNAGAEPYNRNTSWPREIERYDSNGIRNNKRGYQGPWENGSYPTTSPWSKGENSYDQASSFQDRSYLRDDPLYERRAQNEDRRPVTSRRDVGLFDHQLTMHEREQYQMELELAEQEFNRPNGRNNSSGYRFNEGPGSYQSEYPRVKRQRLEPTDEIWPGVAAPIWSSVGPLIVVWPITLHSILEDRAKEILEANFLVEYQEVNPISVAVSVNLPMRNGSTKSFCLGVGNNQSSAAITALNLIVRHSTIIKPNPTFLCNGTTPNFVRFKVPCHKNPRTYIILDKSDTGPLSEQRLAEILNTFKASYNEDVYFDKDTFTLGEKRSILRIAPQLGLNVRHFGDTLNMLDRYVCVYKVKSQNELLEEVLTMGGNHPKYIICNNM